MARVTLFVDLIDHMVDNLGGEAQDRENRKIARAINDGMEDLIHVRPWTYFVRQGRVILDANYSTGTITYDHTGGASERLLTTTGVMPTNFAKGRVLIGDIVSNCATRESSTTGTLDPIVNPGADVAALTTWEWYRTHYSLPAGFRSMSLPEEEDGYGSVNYIVPERWMQLERHNNTGGDAYRCTLLQDEDNTGGYSLVFDPHPTAAKTIDFIYQTSPRDLRWGGYETNATVGTVSVSAGGTAVTGSGTSFDSTMAGSFIRFQTGTTNPTGLSGTNPYAEQLRIASVESTTACTLQNAAVAAYSGKKYMISDPIELDRTLYLALIRATEHQYALAKGGSAGTRMAGYQRALIHALEWDDKVHEEWSSGTIPYWWGHGYKVVF